MVKKKEVELLPEIIEVPQETEVFEDLSAEIEADSGGLQLMENVFDKRVTDEDIEQEKAQIEGQSTARSLIDAKDIETKTDLSDKEIPHLTVLDTMCERYSMPILNRYLWHYRKNKISRNRLSRREYASTLSIEKEQQSQGGVLSRIFGGGGPQ